jgi:hypothetical protein
MMQFARYLGNEPELINLFRIIDRNNICSQSSINKYAADIALWLESINSANPAYAECSRRAALILGRLFFWSGRKNEQIYETLKSLKHVVSQVSDSYSVQELTHTLGVKNCTELGCKSLHLSTIQNLAQTGKIYQELLDLDAEILVYTPNLSGFYSILENIVNAYVLAELHNKILAVNVNNSWWPYPLSFDEIFSGIFLTTDLMGKIHPKKKMVSLPFEQFRGLFSHLCALDPKTAYQKKERMYGVIRQTLTNISGVRPSFLSELKDSGVLYIRGGDKLVFEAISVPEEFLVADIEKMLNRVSRVFLISDDYMRAQSLIEKVDNKYVFNLTEEMFSGYYNSSANPTLERKDIATFDDMRAIIKNYVYIATSGLSSSCPSTNIVNSAHWSNEMVTHEEWAAVPIHKYLIL